MSFFHSFKRALGFSDNELEEEELEGIDATVIPLNQRNNQTPKQESAAQAESQAPEAESADRPDDAWVEAPSSAVPTRLFDGVVKIFNESLPPFVAETVDREAQAEYIYRSLDASVKSYLEQIEIDARRRCNDRWENERRNMQLQMESLKAKSLKDEEETSEIKKLNLSVERQKRALSERIRDLEAQLVKAESEMEQLTLENKSMANKLRVSTVLGVEPDVDSDRMRQAMEEHVAGLQAKLDQAGADAEALRKQLAEANAMADSRQKEVEVLTKQVQDASAAHDASAEELNRVKAANTESLAEIEALKKALDQSKVHDDVGNAIVSGLNNQLGTAKEELEAARNELEVFKNELETAMNELAELQDKHARLTDEHAKLTDENEKTKLQLEKALDDLSIVDEMNTQLVRLEEARKSNEAVLRKQKEDLARQKEDLTRQAEDLARQTDRVASLESENFELNQKLTHRDGEIHHLKQSNDSLRKTIESNLYEHAQARSALQAEINRLRSLKGVDAAKEADEKAGINAELLSDSSDFSTPAPAPAHAGKRKAENTPADPPLSYSDKRRSLLSPALGSAHAGKRKAENIADNQSHNSENQTHNTNRPAADPGKPAGKSAPGQTLRISAIDESIEDTDWLVAAPPDPKKKAEPEDDADFGYKAPSKKTQPDAPGQMLLF